MFSTSLQLANRAHGDITQNTLVVLDAAIDDLSALVADLPAGTKSLVLNGTKDGIEQITEALKNHQAVTELHIVSHGTPGCLHLGNTKLSLETLGHYEKQIEAWSQVLENADVLVYGCQAAEGVFGALFLQRMAQLTGANFAASTQRVGRVNGQPNWSLNTHFGHITAKPIFSEALQQNYTGSFIPEVSLSINEDSFIETEESTLVFTFNLSEAPPAEGVKIRLTSDEVSSFNRLNITPEFFGGPLRLTGISGLPEDVSPNLDFSVLEVTITDQTATISAPVFNSQSDESLDGPNNPSIEDFADVAETITWSLVEADGSATVNASAGQVPVTFFDNPGQVVPATPTVSLAGSPTLIVEDEGTRAIIEFELDQPAPAGGLNVSIATAAFRGLADFDVFNFQETQFSNLQPVQGFAGNDGIVVRILEGATTAAVSFVVFDDADLDSTDPNVTVNDDIGIDEQTWSFDPQFAIDNGLGAALSDYNIAPGADSFTWTIVDTRGQLNAPVATDDEGSTAEDGVLNANVLTNDTDADGDTLSVTAVNGEAANVGTQITLASGALLTVNADGTYSYDPNSQFDNLNAGETATDSFIYTTTDGNQSSEGVFNEDAATVAITINGDGTANTAPIAVDDTFTIAEDTVLNNTVAANDSDNEGDPLAYSVVSDVANGSLSFNPDGSFAYTPDDDFNGPDSFTYEVSDGEFAASATADITVSPVDDTPVVSFSTTSGTLSEADGSELVLNFSVDGDIPEGGITVNLEGDTAEILQQFLAPDGDGAVQTRVTDDGNILYRFDTSFGPGAGLVGGTLNVFSLEDGDPAEDNSDPAAAGTGFLSNFSFTITEPTASITLPVSDDLVQEVDQTFTYTLAEGDGYEVDPAANSGTFTVSDGITPTTSPVVGVSATPDVLVESEQTVFTVTFTTEGDIPDDGLVVQLQGPPRAIAEFDVNATNPRLPESETVVEGVVLEGASIVGTDEVAGSLFLRITDPTATVTVPVFDDGPGEGSEDLTFNLVDGEAYEVDAAAGSINLTIEDEPIILPDPVVSFSTTPGTISEADGTELVLNFSVDGDIPPEGITVNLEGDAARIMQQFTAAQTRFDSDTGEIFYRFDKGLVNSTNGSVVGGTLELFSLEDGDPSEAASDPAAAGDAFLTNFSFTITEANASITIPVVDDIIQEDDATFTYNLVAGDGYAVSESANSGTFTVTDGVTPATAPTVGVTATPGTLIEDEQTVFTLTFDTVGDIPPEGVVVQLEGPVRALSEFDINATNPRLPESETVVEGVNVTGGNIVGTDNVAGSVFFRITDPTATITVPVFDDDVAEGSENLTFSLLDGEAYEVDATASSIDVSIEDSVDDPSIIEGTNKGERIIGTGGDDIINSAGGADRVLGRDGDDTIDGGNGNDSLIGGDGNDVITGGRGRDRILGQSGDDTINGGVGNDRILGGSGNDILNGAAGEDRILGGSGDDIILGGFANDRILGGEGRDILLGEGGKDLLRGGGGDDVLMGVTGDDVLLGGSGSELFVFGTGDGTDIIRDFEIGIDQIGLVAGELTFEDLTITQQGGSTILGIADSGESLAILRSVQASALDTNSFVTVDNVTTVEDALQLI